MFVGSVPKTVVGQILDTVDFASWPAIFVCCSGSFRVDLTIKSLHPGKAITSNDVSLYSVSLGRLMTGEPFHVAFTNRLSFIEDLIGEDAIARVAAVLVAHEMANYKGDNEWARTYFNHYVTSFEVYHRQAMEKLTALLAGPVIDKLVVADFRAMLPLAIEASGGIIAFPPTHKGRYERIFKFVDENTEWDRPAYDIWDPANLESWVEELKAAGVPYCVFSDHLFKNPDLNLVTSYSTDGRKAVYTYATTKAASVWQTRHKSTPFIYEPVDPALLTKGTKVLLVPATSQQLNFLKDIFFAKSIAHVSGEASYLVYLDGRLAGGFIYKLDEFGGHYGIYLLSDFAIVTERKLSKLICLLATSRLPVDDFGRSRLARFTKLSTTAFTKRSVSMKYRGVFKVFNRKPGMIKYQSHVREETPQALYRHWYRTWAGDADSGKKT